MQSSSSHPQSLLSRLLSAFARLLSIGAKTNCLIACASFFSAQLAMLWHIYKTYAKNKLTNSEKFANILPPTNKTNTMQHTPTKEEIAALIDATKGKFFSLTFAKKDGTIRTINAKDRFTGLVKGTGSPATNALRQGGYMFAVDRNRNSYFCFKPEKVLALKCGKIDKEFSIVVD
jgi:hypothetical protein